ncbi:tRNA (adenosine(37)-N6)-threonylcarbamoyltransferase complex ATPase subunit type 1 TsaE [Persephonella sp.]
MDLNLYKTVKVKNLDELESFASKISKCLKGKEVILLKGDLGSGKTTFTRFLVSSIDAEAGEYVNSPTFSVMNEYDTKKFKIYHIDLYRVKKFDLSDVLGEGIVIVEWPGEYLYGIELPQLVLDFNITGENEREISVYIKDADYMMECI